MEPLPPPLPIHSLRRQAIRILDRARRPEVSEISTHKGKNGSTIQVPYKNADNDTRKICKLCE